MRSYFGGGIEAIAAQWRTEPVRQLSIKQASRYSGTYDGVCLVDMEDGYRAFLKPRPQNPSPITVAREKVASDLAYDLGLPVAPVMVKPRCATWPYAAALSLVSLPSPRPWGAFNEERCSRSVTQLEQLRVFWTWIGDTDHDGNEENLLYEVHDEALKLCAIDHGRSLGHGVIGDVLAFKASLGYGTAALDGADTAREAFIDIVHALGDECLDIIVRRLDVILTQPEQDQMIDLLKRRRDNLSRLLEGE